MKRNFVTLLGGEYLDLTSGEYAGKNLCVQFIHAGGLNSRFSARTRDNTTGAKKDHSSTGVYVAGDTSKCLLMNGPFAEGAFDIVFCPAGSDPIRCEIVGGWGI